MNTLTSAALRQTCWGLMAIIVSLPILFGLHRALGLEPPPGKGVLILSLSVLAAFAGGGALGHVIGGATGRSAGVGPAALGGFVWGVVMCALVVPLYGQMIFDEVTRDVAARAWRERNQLIGRDRLIQRGRDVQQGRGREVAGEVLSGGREAIIKNAASVARSGAARLPSLSLLVWALIGPILAAALEARRVRRK